MYKFLKNAFFIAMTASVFVQSDADAASSVWNLSPGSNDLNTAANWTPGAVPSTPGDAIFNTSNTTNPLLSVGALFDVDNVIFNAPASAYTFTITSSRLFRVEGFAGAGGVNNTASSNLQLFTLTDSGEMQFFNSSSADVGSTGTVSYLVDATGNTGTALDFEDTSTAGGSLITIQNRGILEFNVSSAGPATAGTALINLNTVSAGEFSNASSAANSTINVNDGSTLVFLDASNPATASLNGNNGFITFNTTGAAATSAKVNLINGADLTVVQSAQIASLNSDASSTTHLASALTVGDLTNQTAAGSISGIGSLIKVGPGKLTLLGTNLYSGGTTVNQGALEGNSNSLEGNIAVNATSILQFNQTFNGTFNGAITGATTAFLNKIGAGTLFFVTNNSGFLGATNITEGKLALNNILGGNVNVSQTGILSGTGTVLGNLTVDNGGTVAPGNSIGTLNQCA